MPRILRPSLNGRTAVFLDLRYYVDQAPRASSQSDSPDLARNVWFSSNHSQVNKTSPTC